MDTKTVQKITQLEEKNRLIADNLIDAIWILDVQTLSYDYITPSIEKISGFKAEELIGKPIQERLTSASLQKIKLMVEKELTTAEKVKSPVKTAEIELIHKNGTLYWVEIRARLVNEANKPLKIIGITREITAQKIAELKQQDLINKLENALAEKAQLLKEVNTLRRLLPICSGCKRIRDEGGKWWPFDAYIAKITEAKLSHTICPDCKDAFYGDEDWYIK